MREGTDWDGDGGHGIRRLGLSIGTLAFCWEKNGAFGVLCCVVGWHLNRTIWVIWRG